MKLLEDGIENSLHATHQWLHFSNCGKGLPQTNKVTWGGMPGKNSIGHPFQVAKWMQCSSQLCPQQAIIQEEFNTIQPAVYLFRVQQRFADPLADQPFAHWCYCMIQCT